jgi:general secretion pathway protein G
MHRRANKRGGFTLLEVLLVVLILGMLAALVVPSFIGTEAKAKRDLARSQVAGAGALANAINQYRLAMGEYPTALEDLTKVPEDAEKKAKYGSTPMIQPGSLKDPWQNDYQYKCPGDINKESFDLYSFAADGKEGGEGDDEDIGNWAKDAK